MDKIFNPQAFEDRIYKEWESGNYFRAETDKTKRPFTIMLPPPNITGQLHMGHALDQTIQDSIIRYKRMKGFSALWMPGTDHASIATEVKIVDKMKEEGLDKNTVGREGFLKRAWEWKEMYGGHIVGQMRKLGASCDWSREAFTMDDNLSHAVKHVFVKLYDKGLIYKADRIINWCPECKTAISDAEVEYSEKEGKLWHIKYPVEGGGFITVATTRPETMLGDTAVAVNPEDKRYKKLIGKYIILPLMNRRIPVVADGYVDKEFGTGAVKITPAHDPNDFEVGVRHNLPVIRVMDDGGIMNENAGSYAALTRDAARGRIVADLDKLGLLEKTEQHIHNVGECYRCSTVIEPIVSKQWFVKMKPLAEPAIDAAKNKSVNFLSPKFEKIYYHWMENIRDWCISRQLWWGHRIPAYYCGDCGKMTVSEQEITKCSCGGHVKQDEDVLDTWFSSALWPFSTLGYPKETEDLKYFYPTDVLVTAYDIIFFWVARMIFSGIENMGEVPFREVLIHGIVRDEQGRKMSKSLGNGVDPLDIISKYGADTLRISLVNGISADGDIKFNGDKLDGCRNFINKLWNASRFVLMNTENAVIKDIKDCELTLADKWILTKLNNTVKDVTAYMDKYEVGFMTSKMYDFVWSDFCDWYIELTKPVLYSDNKPMRDNTVSVLVHVLKQALKLLHPIAPFVTEEIYAEFKEGMLITASFPEYSTDTVFEKEYAEMVQVMELIGKIRSMRAEMSVSQAKRTLINILPKNKEIVDKSAVYIEKLGMANKLVLTDKFPTEKSISVSCEIAHAFIPMGELIDIDKERERLNNELYKAKDELKRAEGKLNNEGFVQKAPQELLNAERNKIEKYKELINTINQRLKELL